MADKCKNEKKALDRAKRETLKAEGRVNTWESEIEEWEAEAQRALGSISECIEPAWSPPAGGGMRWHIEGEYRIDEKCVIDKWVYAYNLLDAARRFRSGPSVYTDYLGALEMLREEEEFRKDAYCDCLNRERPR